MAPADVLPPKKQAVVERLRRRIESYRRHQNDCIPRFDHSFNCVVEQNLQDTLLLKQRFLENKAKRGIKKSDKKQPDGSIPKFGAKRSASEELEINGENLNNDASSNKGQPPSAKPNEGLTKFSVEIVQQLEFTTTTTNSQISTNVTVKALNTSVKSDVPQSPKPQTPRNPDLVECKREPENVDFVDLEQCAAAVEKDAAGGSSFPGFSDFICDDTSDAIITSDAFNDLISEISEFNPEFMKDFDFDGGDTKPQITDEQQKHDNSGKTQQGNMRSHPSCQNKINFSPNVEFKAELSPAAQTLKHMAEQHQHKTQLNLGYNTPRPSPKSYDFQFNAGNDFSNTNPPSNQPTFKQSIASPPCSLSFNADTIKQEVFSNQSPSMGYSPSSKNPSPQQVRLSTGYKPQYSYNSPPSNGNSNFPTNRPQPQQPCGGGQPSAQQPKPPPQQQQQQSQPPRPPSSGTSNQFGGSSVQVNQVQQVQTQGQSQVSLAQSMNGEMKGGNLSLAAQQAVFMAGSPSSFCAATQSQTINFTQQNLRQRTPSKPTHPVAVRPPHPQVIDVMGGHVGAQSLGSRPDYSKGLPPTLRFQPRMLPLQPMQSTGPMIRTSQGPFRGSQNVGNVHHPRHHPYNPGNPRHLLSHTSDSTGNWRPMLSQQHRPQFLQAQGVTFSSGDTQLSAGQMQHSNMPLHQQSLGIHQVNPTMSLRIQMSQNMTGSVYTSSHSRLPNVGLRHPTLTSPSFPATSVSSSFSSSLFTEQHPPQPEPQLQPQASQPHSNFHPNSLPTDFNLDFLEQFPGSDNANFTEQEFLNSFESSTPFNFQDIL